MMKRVAAIFLLLVAGYCALPAHAQVSSRDGAVFVAYFWRAKPGQGDAYGDYIRKTAEPIDENARREIVTGHRSQVTGRASQVASHRSRVTGR